MRIEDTRILYRILKRHDLIKQYGIAVHEWLKPNRRKFKTLQGFNREFPMDSIATWFEFVSNEALLHNLVKDKEWLKIKNH